MSSNQPSEGLTGRKIIYDEDGKPCRSCNTLEDFKFVTGKITGKPVGSTSSAKSTHHIPKTSKLIPGSKIYEKQDPPDVNELGKSTWNFLHSMAAKYPVNPSSQQKSEMNQFFNIFSHIYPCNWCADDFEKYIRENAPRVNSRDELGRWLCDAHNQVNEKLGKEKFNCNLWDKRWRTGWDE
ncbi:hypothetical protein Kpol_385p8 [Vanderwaltozyma polyspora DSM 70294]|uniref:Sulfhydryl oxidase n=1 Tax=Vanderwaltozyma polyspora (strain ATCC 22028 / DSM 70294 / BCRC 21397 / CBS 2163 / NBRC 10782 / NRRL Y-8283 / UCD 57-17) TaxID=436907 RepID=A7TS20_VANPO|nr:uncharacterized protein Kpol_385p8 [Vanderwaltozyma polyspora DSM 70294]EDO14939.1 hypothetical protein Kpol_385p8 [Vanderwaltozyma polyspora DSM 70294]